MGRGCGSGSHLTWHWGQKIGELEADTFYYFSRADAFRQQIYVHYFVGGENHGALGYIFQLTHVAWPVVVH